MIGCIGTDHKKASLSIREKILRSLLLLKQPSVLISTCHRVEWYFSTKSPEILCDALFPYKQHLYSLFGQDCFHHLNRVVSGLDSLFIGETEIQGQVKSAYEQARKEYSLSKELHFLFQRALHTGKILRSSFSLPQNSLTDQVVQTIESFCFSKKEVLLVGTSSINCQIAQQLQQKGFAITFSNRTHSRAESVAEQLGVHILPWKHLKSLCCSFPCVITATKAHEYLLSSSDIDQSDERQLFIDLSVPRNIDPSIHRAEKVLINIEAFAPMPYHQAKTDLLQRSKKEYQKLLKRSPVSSSR
jgi:glutamyl-tRNA reductase